MIERNDKVEHVRDAALGVGTVKWLETRAGRVTYTVRWSNTREVKEHTPEELTRIAPIHERLVEAGVASRLPFQLKVFARWFEARHALTGELSNQPFQMLPHQVIVTNRVINSAPEGRAWLIADDVGLGKTIEAGMIMEVLRKRTLGRFRCLIVAPAGLVTQWQEEMKRRFRRFFRVFSSRDVNALETDDQLVASIDTLKALKFKGAIEQSTPWDLVIFDEAHHLATTPSVQSYQLAQGLRASDKARNCLFLSATPHSGNNEHFFNMLRILREDMFPKGRKDYESGLLKNVMIRNRKSEVTDVRGDRIFKGIAPAKIIPFVPSAEEVKFYEDLRSYLRNGYKAAERLEREKEKQKASAVGFLMATFSKLASSSRAAIENALQNRIDALRGDAVDTASSADADARYADTEAQATIAGAGLREAKSKGKSKKRDSVIEGELKEVEDLLSRLQNLREADSKLTSFVAQMRKLDESLKVLIFTEYRATQVELVRELEAAFGEGCVAQINGSMDREERAKEVHRFNELPNDPRFMVSTEAGGEGLNMQKSCHTIINYDLPWNPMALQQRIGRVYRYGQRQPVVVFNLKVDSTSEAFADQKIYEYLERKIDEVTNKLHEVQDGSPEDIRGEVLGQIVAHVKLDDVYKQSVAEGLASAQKGIDATANQVAEIMRNGDMLGIFKGLDRFDITDYEKVAARVRAEHLDFFVKQYLGREGVTLRPDLDGLFSFAPPKRLVDEVNRAENADRYQERDALPPGVIERATVDKDVAQRALNCRLLRFGDAAFEGMVRQAQHGSNGGLNDVASVELPGAALGWSTGEDGTWVLFDLRITKDGSQGMRVLRHELASVLVRRGDAPTVRDDVVESLHLAFDGNPNVDGAEAKRAYELARAAAEERLRALHEEVSKDFGTQEGVVPQEVQDVALAWVRAS